MELTYKFELSDEAFELLKEINKEGYAEYRDTQYQTLSDFKKGDTFKNGHRTEESFLARNFNGTYSLANELANHNLIDNNFDAWHCTFVMSDLGREILKQNS